MKFYECDFAPCAATRRDVIRVAQLVHDEGGSAYEAFAPAAFKGWGQSDIPILIDHDVTRRAGTVTALSAFGDWWRGSFMLDGPDAGKAEEIIERGGKVSPSFEPLEKDPDFARPITLAHTPTHWYLRARLTEISIASPHATPWYRGARVTRCYQSKAPAPSTRQGLVARETEGEVIYGDGQPIIRHGVGKILRVEGVPF